MIKPLSCKKYPALLGMIVIACLCSACSFMGIGAAPKVIRYRIAKSAVASIQKTVSATGVLTPWTVVDIKSRAGGRIDELPVHLGTIVTRGQLIARIDPTDTLLTYHNAVADKSSGVAQVQQANKTLDMQRIQSQVAIDNASASLSAARAAAASALARYQSAVADSGSQGSITSAAIASATATLNAQQAKLDQMNSATIPQERAQALADLDQAKANLLNANAQLDRQTVLVKNGYLAQSSLDQTRATRDVDQAVYNTTLAKYKTLDPQLAQDIAAQKAAVAQAKAALNSAQADSVQISLKKSAARSALADYHQAQAAVTQAVANLEQAKIQLLNNSVRKAQIQQAAASVVRANAELANANVQLADTNVRAPSTGIVLQKYVEQGTYITSGMSFNSSGTSIVQLGNISRMYVDTSVDETDIANVTIGQKVDITFDAYPTVPFDGTVIKIDPAEVVASNVTTLHVRVEVDNSSITYRLLKPGMNGTCDFIVDNRDNVLAVPNEAVKTAADGSTYCLVVHGGHTATPDAGATPDPSVIAGCKVERVPVTIGLAGDDHTEIKSGLKPGDIVVTQTIKPLAPGAGGLGGGP